MKTIKRVDIEPVFVDLIPEQEEMQEGKIYISKQYNTSSHLCLCGCKGLTVLPINRDGWQLTVYKEKISFHPSIGNYQFPCKSHYIITNNKANFV